MFTRVVTMALLMVQFAHAQGQLNATFRPGFNFPVRDFDSTTLKKGSGFEVTITYCFIPRLAAYAGWGRNAFNPEKSNNSVAHVEETGYRFGLQFIQPLSSKSILNFLLSAGGILKHIRTESDAGDRVADTGHGLGWEAGAALSIPLNKPCKQFVVFSFIAITAVSYIYLRVVSYVVCATPSRIAASSISMFISFSVLNLMQYPVTLALPNFFPYV
jgi:hypothetical protein